MTIRFEGVVAASDRPTRDRREIPPGALAVAPLPVPGMAKFTTGGRGHDGAVTVARVDEFFDVDNGWFMAGEFLDPAIVPEVTRAVYLLQQGVAGPSIDLEPNATVEYSYDGDQETIRVVEGTVAGVTFVPLPAFSGLRMMVTDDRDNAMLASAGISLPRNQFVVNSNAWRGLPIAPRESKFDNDDAIKRIAGWAGVGTDTQNEGRFAKAFLWNSPDANLGDADGYKLPIGDIIDGKLHLIYHAIYAASALIEGAHGGLPKVPDADKNVLRKVISRIYERFAKEFGDPNMKAPWDNPGKRTNPVTAASSWCAPENTLTDANLADTIPPPFAGKEDAMTAAAAPAAAPRHWYANPQLAKPTPLTITQEGRVFGHLATWGTCHTGIGNACVMAPKSHAGYAYFKVGKALTADGAAQAVGVITLGTGHADMKYGLIPARDHYDNTGWAVATVNVGEDAHGIWFSGPLLPNVTDEQVATLRRSPLSGDWRRVNGNLELVAALAVNNPGFPVLRVDGDDSFSLIAAGWVEQPSEPEATTPALVDVGQVDVAQIAAATAELMEARGARLAGISAARAAQMQAARAARLAKLKGE